MIARSLAVLVIVLMGTLATSRSIVQAESANRHPHVVLILVDDLGWADLGCYGSSYHQTPQLDRMAKSSCRFTHAYSAGSVCSPTRAALMTGRHPVRVGITDWIPGESDQGHPMRIPEDRNHLPLEEETIAESFQTSGYRTFYAGKWHLGGHGHSPREQGFQHYQDPLDRPEAGSPAKNRLSYRPHASDWLTDQTIAFLESSAAKGPTFSVLSFYDVHTPIVAEQSMLEHFRERLEAGNERTDLLEQAAKTRSRQDSPPYATMVHEVDHQVGRLLRTMERLGILDDSIVVFTSDNGGLSTLLKNSGPTSNLPLRAGKGWLYEGGIRVPLLVRLPDGMERTIDAPLVTMDLFPTLLDLAGLPDSETAIDGVSWKGTLLQDQPPPKRPHFWHYPHYHGSGWTGGSALQHEGWKLIEFSSDGRKELFYLPEDPGESRDLAANQPGKVAELSQMLNQWRRSLDAGKMVAKEETEVE